MSYGIEDIKKSVELLEQNPMDQMVMMGAFTALLGYCFNNDFDPIAQLRSSLDRSKRVADQDLERGIK